MFLLLSLLLVPLVAARGLPVSTGTCVDSCANVTDGNYQACGRCDVYVYVYWPPDLVWDDQRKHCGFFSQTCTPSGETCMETNTCGCFDEQGNLREVGEQWFGSECQYLYRCKAGRGAGWPYISRDESICYLSRRHACQYIDGKPTCAQELDEFIVKPNRFRLDNTGP